MVDYFQSKLGLPAERRGGWHSPLRLNNPFSNDALAKLIGPDEYAVAHAEKMGADAASRVHKYLRAYQEVWGKNR